MRANAANGPPRRELTGSGLAPNKEQNVRQEELWRSDLPFVKRTEVSVLGPPVDVWKCAGDIALDPTSSTLCARDWNTWASTVLGEPAK